MAGVAEGHVTSKAAGYYHCFIIYQNHFTSKRPGFLCSCSLPTPCLASQRPPANHAACHPGKGNHIQVGQSPQGRAFFPLSVNGRKQKVRSVNQSGIFREDWEVYGGLATESVLRMKGSQETALKRINKKVHTFWPSIRRFLSSCHLLKLPTLSKKTNITKPTQINYHTVEPFRFSQQIKHSTTPGSENITNIYSECVQARGRVPNHN